MSEWHERKTNPLGKWEHKEYNAVIAVIREDLLSDHDILSANSSTVDT